MDVSLALLPGSRGKLWLLFCVDLLHCPSVSHVEISFCALNMSCGDVVLPVSFIHCWAVAVFCFSMLFKELAPCQVQRCALVGHRRIITYFLPAVPVLACGGDDSKVHLYVQNSEQVWL